MVLDGKQHEAVRVLLKDWFLCLLLFESRCYGRLCLLLRFVVEGDTLDGDSDLVTLDILLVGFYREDWLLDW